MRDKENDLDALGVEALPGGLELRVPGDGSSLPVATSRTRAAPRLLGLVELVKSWMARRARRA